MVFTWDGLGREQRVDLRDRRDLYNGFGNGLNRAFELVVVPLVFAVPGWGLDRWLGTGPFLAILTGAFGLAGVCVRAYWEYSTKMDALQAELPSPGASPKDRQAVDA